MFIAAVFVKVRSQSAKCRLKNNGPFLIFRVGIMLKE